ncbi:MAG: hypothetical protein EP332_08285 [Bacteroidetes bacterium]|nr:MAG: hypothetical protein EP332_08285 [Bacteroidota bacterium]
MKKSLILAAGLAFCQLSYGQISKGALYVTGFGSVQGSGGETSISNNGNTFSSEHNRTFNGSFGLGAGYFLNDNIAAGASLNFMGSKVTPADTSDPVEKSSGFGIGLFGRYYVPLGESFYFHGQLGLNFDNSSSYSEKNGVVTDDPRITTIGLGIRPGFTYFPTKKIGLDVMFGNLGWSRTSSYQEIGTATQRGYDNNFMANFNLTNVTFGVQYFLF